MGTGAVGQGEELPAGGYSTVGDVGGQQFPGHQNSQKDLGVPSEKK